MSDGLPRHRTFLADLKRRRVFKVAAVYGAAGFGALQLADVLFPRLGLPEWSITLVAAVAIVCFPIALVLAWAFEVTPEGVRRTDAAPAVELEAIATEAVSRRWPSGILALLGLGLLAAGGWWVLRPEPSAPAGAPAGLPREAEAGIDRASIAVLPFVSLSEDRADEYFGDGLAEELINVLAAVPGLKVAARTSAFSFKGQNVDVRRIADTLDVANVLEGSVRRSGDRVRITAQLIQASDGFHLWSKSYDRQLIDIFAVQEEIAASIAEALRVSLGGEIRRAVERRRTGDLEAYDLYLLGRSRWATRSDENLVEALEYFQAAIERDSAYAPAWAGLAAVYDALPWYSGWPAEETGGKGKAAALRALELDPELAEAHASLGVLIYEFDWQWDEAETHLRRALELEPDDVWANDWYGQLLGTVGRLEEALRVCQHAVEVDPLAWHPAYCESYTLALAGRLAEAVDAYDRPVILDAKVPENLLERAHFLLLLSRFEEAADALVGWARLEGFARPERAREIVTGIADPSRRGAALRAMEEMRAEGRDEPFFWIAPYLLLGEKETALKLVETAYHGRNPNVIWLGTDPRYDALRSEPRFVRILDELKLPNGR